MEKIIPSSDLRNRYADISRQCREDSSVIHVTVNGRSDTVILSETAYAQMQTELELLRTLAEAEQDVEQGRIAPAEPMFNDLRAGLLARKNR